MFLALHEIPMDPFLKKEALRSSDTDAGAYFDVHHSMTSSDVSVRFFG